MQMFRRKWLTHVMLLFVVMALVVSFTAVAQAGGGEEEPAPAAEEESPPMGKPPMGKPPMGKPVKPIPELANCIGVTAFYDGNLNGIVDANEDAMDGASIVLMQEAGPPPEDPPIGPNGEEIVMEMPKMGGMPMMGPPPVKGPPMGPPQKPEGPPMPPPSAPEKPMGPPMGPPQKPDGPPMKPPSAPEKPMGPPMGPPKDMMAEKTMPVKPTPQYIVLDRKITRDGGIAVFCDLKPGTYVLQGDAVEGITVGPNRGYVKLVEDDFQEIAFGFSYLNGGPESTNNNGG